MTVVLITLGSVACTSPASNTSGGHGESPAVIEAIPGSAVKKVTLTEQAARRVGVTTVTLGSARAVPPQGPSPSPGAPGTVAPGTVAPGTVVPYAAVLYDPEGVTWVYTVPQPLTYVREKVVVATVGGADGTEAFLSQAPPAGTTVVTTGVIELWGAELGVGK